MLSENTSIIGRPDISFTLNNEPDKLSVTENNSPCEPCTVNIGCAEPDPITVNIEPDAAVLNDPDSLRYEPDIGPFTLKLPDIPAEPVNGNAAPPPDPVATVIAKVLPSPFVKVMTFWLADAVTNRDPVFVVPPPPDKLPVIPPVTINEPVIITLPTVVNAVSFVFWVANLKADLLTPVNAEFEPLRVMSKPVIDWLLTEALMFGVMRLQ